VPVYQLLGGKQRDRVRLHLLVNASDLDELAAKCADAKVAGYTAVKIDPLPGGFIETASHSAIIQEAVQRVSTVRETVGWDVDVIVEGHRKLGPGEAVALAAELEPFRPYFYEDPIPHDSIESHREIGRKIRVPLAVGERHLSIYEFRDLLTGGSIQFVRPDVGLAGGLTHCKKIATVAEAFHAQVVAHNFFSPLLTAATAQLYASIPNAGTFEYWQDAEEAPPRTQLLKDQLVRDGGYLLIPKGPGLGVHVNEEAIPEFPPFETWRPGSIRLRADGSFYSR
jgi:galactonate dehydratase